MGYMTAGELAQKVGVTLRAVQYYDQQGLLPPSERGPNNLRLYSTSDEQRLYRILVLKYMGLSLAQIRESIDELDRNDAIIKLINARISHIETEFHDLFKKLQTLHEVRSNLLGLNSPDWHRLASVIEHTQDQGHMIWQMIGTVDSMEAEVSDEDETERHEYLVRLHEIVGEAMELLRSGQAMDSPENHSLAQRAYKLFSEYGDRFSQSTLIMGNAFENATHPEGFDGLSSQVVDYLQAVIDANLSEEKKDFTL